MNLRFLSVLILSALISACTFDQLGQAAYGSLEGQECKDKTGGLSCDLDERSTDERLMNGAPGAMTNEEMEEEVKKNHKKNDTT